MSGHSHWATIRRKKGAADAKKGAIFTRLAREIVMAAREGGGDPDSNFRLALAIEKARGGNMPKENIERAIKRGTGDDKDGSVFEEITYEGYGPHSVALMFECVTDNRNRAVAEIRHLISRSGGNMAEAGAVGWQFTRHSYFSFPASMLNFDKAFELAVEAGAEDVSADGDNIEIIGPVEAFKKISDALKKADVTPDDAGLRMIAKQDMELPVDQTLAVLRVIESLEELDDVANVFHNLKISEEALAALEAEEEMALVLGIDPGTATTGYGLVRDRADGSLESVAYGTLQTPAGVAAHQRLSMLFHQLTELLLLHRPDSCAVEKLFFQSNVKTAIAVGQARGVVLLAISEAGLEMAEYTPNEVKQAVSGYGSAGKKQVQEMVRVLLTLAEIPKPDDAADALAIAITHLHTRRY